ncbi:MAG: hypothetical protein WB297_03645 [Actinomycetota bacterium]
MSESERMTPDEIRAHRKTMLRARKAIEAIEAEMTATHFRCWEMEMQYPGAERPTDDEPNPKWN